MAFGADSLIKDARVTVPVHVTATAVSGTVTDRFGFQLTVFEPTPASRE